MLHFHGALKGSVDRGFYRPIQWVEKDEHSVPKEIDDNAFTFLYHLVI
jgi:hypothetical protein